MGPAFERVLPLSYSAPPPSTTCGGLQTPKGVASSHTA